jgi:glycosyltransferase involved in cell wall biosynthesis
MVTASVIIPTYNYGRFIGEAINSVLGQTYPREDIEIIVVDDGSTDDTREVLKELIDNQTIQYHYQENQGKACATRLGVQLSQGRFLFNLDADDYFYPTKITEVVRVFNTYPDVVHVGTPATFVNEATGTSISEVLPPDIVGRPLDGKQLLKRFYRDNILFGGGSTYAARATSLKAVAIADGSDMYIDEFLILALLPYGQSYFIAEPLSAWRIHQLNYSVGNAGPDLQRQKAERLLRSSAATLAYVEQHDFDPEIVGFYRLQHATRTMAFKETFRSKSVADIASYAYRVFFQIRPGWHAVRKYHVLNRLIPGPVFRALKKLKPAP